MGKGSQPPEEEFDLIGALLDGRDLEHPQVVALERELLDFPSKLKARFLLLGFYERGSYKDGEENTGPFLKHLIWMINNRPENPALSHSQHFSYKNRAFQKV